MPQLHSYWLRLLEASIGATDRFATRVKRRMRKPAHLELGRRGEEAAYFYVRRLGFIVVARGWRSARLRGDLDLIAWEGDILCFVEVKTRTSRSFATAESAVDQEKSRMLRAMARQYLRQLPSAPKQTRFDILSIYFDGKQSAEFELFRGAFAWQ